MTNPKVIETNESVVQIKENPSIHSYPSETKESQIEKMLNGSEKVTKMLNQLNNERQSIIN